MGTRTQQQLPQVRIRLQNHQWKLGGCSHSKKTHCSLKLVLGSPWDVDPHLSEPTFLPGAEGSIASVLCHMEEK